MLCGTSEALAQQPFPFQEGERAQYAAYIEMPQGYVSGVCVLVNDGSVVRGSIFNEFGITALDFTYRIQKEKVKLHSVLPMMDRWYIRRVLRRDLAQLLTGLQQGRMTYTNTRRHITYQLAPLENQTDTLTEGVTKIGIKTDDFKR